MTKTKKARRARPRLVPTLPRTALVDAIWQAFTGTDAPPGEEPVLVSLSERYPLADLEAVFLWIEWIELPFDPDDQRVPDHPPSTEPVEGCPCVLCTQRPRLNRWVKP